MVFSALYLLLIYNLSLISIEREWGRLETQSTKLRATLAKGVGLRQSYFQQIPSYIIIPTMIFSSLMHWLIGQCMQAREWVLFGDGHREEHVIYDVAYAPAPLFAATGFMLLMTAVCWRLFFNTREGFIPTMYGSVRVIWASTMKLEEIGERGVKWGDRE